MPDLNTSPSFSWRPVSLLAGVLSVRMLGIFMVLPVLALYAGKLPGATSLLVGLAVGIYGVTQALLQIPLGALSDHIGRKPVIVMGLLVFALGSALAAMGENIAWVIAGRALQGAGAISATVIALVADLTPAVRRTRAMAVVGISIGASFSLALILGPVLSAWVGVPGLFWITLGLALVAAVGLWVLVPGVLVPARVSGQVSTQVSTRGQTRTQSATPRISWRLLAAPGLRGLNGSVFLLHMLLTALFVVLPGVLLHRAGLPTMHHWWLYLPALIVSLVLMMPLIKRAERNDRTQHQATVMAVALLGVGLLVLALAINLATANTLVWWLAGGLVLFFGGFNFLEAHMPASLSRLASPAQRGAALGGYATCQFLGAFAGGVLGGLLMGILAASAVFYGACAVALAWLLGLLWSKRQSAPDVPSV